MSRTATFWDRRRAAVQAEEEAAVVAQQEAADAEQQQALVERSDEDILSELGLPHPDTLTKGDDFAAFMVKAVPEHLRKRALRKLWRSDPVLACVDGLNDYDDDYLTGSFNNAPIKTNYQVGKGLLEHVLDTMRPDEAATPIALDKEDILAEDAPREDPVELEEASAPDTPTVLAEVPDHSKPRRMVFYFDGGST